MTVLLLGGGITEPGFGGWRVLSVALKMSFKFALLIYKHLYRPYAPPLPVAGVPWLHQLPKD